MRGHWAVFALLCLSSIFMKISTIVVLLWFVMLMVYHLSGRKNAFQECLIGVSVPCLIAILWLIENILVSECLLYPEADSCFNVTWSTQNNAEDDARWITAWARHSDSGLYSLTTFDWFPNWWLPKYRLFLLDLAVSGFVTGALYVVIKLRFEYCCSRKIEFRYIATGLFVVFSLGFWFLNAPDPKFRVGVFVILSPALLLPLREIVSLKISTTFVRKAAPFFAFAFLLLFTEPFQRLSTSDLLDFDMLSVPRVATKKDVVYGVRPVKGDQCRLVAECSPHDRPDREELNGYAIFYSGR